MQQALAHLGRQPQRLDIGRIGNDVGGILEPQAILDQAGFACLGEQFLEYLLKAFGVDASAKVGAIGVMRHLDLQGHAKKPTKGEVGPGSFDDLPVGQLVMEAQKEDFEHADRIDGGPAHDWVIGFGEARPKALEINAFSDLAQIMIVGHNDVKQKAIGFGQRRWWYCRQHGSGLHTQGETSGITRRISRLPILHHSRLSSCELREFADFCESPRLPNGL